MNRRIAALVIGCMMLTACQSTVRNGPVVVMDDLVSEFPTDQAVASGSTTTGSSTSSGTTTGGTTTGSSTSSGTTTGGTTTGGTTTGGTTTGGTTIGGATTGTTSGGTTSGGTTSGGTSAGGTTTGGTATTPPADQGAGQPQPTAQPTQPSNDPFAGREMGPGVSEDAILLGIHLTTDLTAAFAAVGANANPADERAIAQAVIDHLNENGGIAGRRIDAVFHETNPADGSWANQAQAACATFTEDNQVFAVVGSAVGGSDALLACLSQKSTPLVSTNFWIFDQEYFTANRGLLYQPSRMMGDRWVTQYVDGLEQAGYLAEGAGGLGLLRFSDPVFERMAENVFKPRLAQYGYELTDEAVIQSPNGINDFGAVSAELNSAVTRFRLSGVTHVMMIENAGIMPFFLWDQAESQGYRPRYAISSQDIPGTQAANAPPEQLANSVAVGWMHGTDQYGSDVQIGHDTYRLCNQIMEEAGLVPSGFYVLPRCDALFFLKAAIENSPAYTASGMLAGVESLGTGYSGMVALNGHTQFGPGRYDGPNAVRLLAYDVSCECYVQTTSPAVIR